MSEEEPTMTTPSMMEQMQAMFTQMRDSINNNNNTINNNINNINNNINDINNTMNHNKDSLRAEINNKLDNKFDTMEACNEARRMELLNLIDQRSRRSHRPTILLEQLQELSVPRHWWQKFMLCWSQEHERLWCLRQR
jgi:septal ring factor EnvC (AmiA/AmiB activator)